jgi:hypothetical protein
VVLVSLSANSSRYPDRLLASVFAARHLNASNTTNDDRGMPRAGIALSDWRREMKFIVQWSGLPTAENAVIERFMKTGGRPPESVKMLGRWHAIGGLHGVAIVESDDPQGMSEMALQWADLLSLNIYPAITDEDLGASLAKYQVAHP